MTCLDNEACSQPTHQEPGGGGGDLGLLSPPQPRPRPLHPPDLHLPRHHRSLRRPLGAPPLRARGDDRHRQRGESMIILENIRKWWRYYKLVLWPSVNLPSQTNFLESVTLSSSIPFQPSVSISHRVILKQVWTLHYFSPYQKIPYCWVKHQTKDL